jgi:hypothetical protein
MRAKNYYIDPRSMLHDNNSCKLVNALSPEKKKKRKEATEKGEVGQCY